MCHHIFHKFSRYVIIIPITSQIMTFRHMSSHAIKFHHILSHVIHASAHFITFNHFFNAFPQQCYITSHHISSYLCVFHHVSPCVMFHHNVGISHHENQSNDCLGIATGLGKAAPTQLWTACLILKTAWQHAR